MKKLTTLVLAALAVGALPLPALAKAPADIADLVGARAPGAESEMQARGYTNVKANVWQNATTGTCVKVSVSQGKYKSIATQKASVCGQKAGAAINDACPPDVSQADRYKYPACKESLGAKI